jgi:hypothetical protein
MRIEKSFSASEIIAAGADSLFQKEKLQKT